MGAPRRRIVVTGGAGFIGAHLCRELVARGAAVTVVDDLSTGCIRNLAGLDVDMRVGTVLDEGLLSDVCAGAHSVVHLAALGSVPMSLADPARAHEVNATGTLRVLRAAAGGHVVLASSAAVYGDNGAPRQAEHFAPRPRSPYAASKVAAETHARACSVSCGQPTLVLRFFNVYGPLQSAEHAYAAVIPAFVSAAVAGRPVTVFGDGQQSRDFVYVGDVARLLATAALERRSSEIPINLASGTGTTVLELVSLLGELLGTAIKVRHATSRRADLRASVANTSLLRAVFPWLDPLPLNAGLAATVDWFRSR